jgi:hypothetical protein
MPLLLHPSCPKPVQISGLGTGTQLSYAQTLQTADLKTNIQSGLLLQVGTSGNTVKCHIISTGLGLEYLQTSLFISIYQTAVGIVRPEEFANEASHFHHKLWENHDPTVQPVITYIYLCGQIYASCLSYFSNSPSQIGQKLNLNVTQALEKPFSIGI